MTKWTVEYALSYGLGRFASLKKVKKYLDTSARFGKIGGLSRKKISGKLFNNQVR